MKHRQLLLTAQYFKKISGATVSCSKISVFIWVGYLLPVLKKSKGSHFLFLSLVILKVYQYFILIIITMESEYPAPLFKFDFKGLGECVTFIYDLYF